MASCGRRTARRGQDGVTLVELIVALGVIGVLLVPLAGTFYTAQSSDAQNRQYGDAIALADSALARDDALAWTALGYYDDQFQSPTAPCPTSPSLSPIPGYNGQSAVRLGCHPQGSASEDVQPVDTSLKVGSVQFTLKTYVVWAIGSGQCKQPNGTTGTCTNAEKQVYAVVTWLHGGQTWSATQNILVYPGGLGTYNGGNQETPPGSTAPPNVNNLTVIQGDPSHPLTYNSLWLQWTDPGTPEPGWYEILAQNSTPAPTVGSASANPYDQSWDPAGATVVGAVAATATSPNPVQYQVTGLSANASYSFVVIAFSPDGSRWAVSNQAAAATTPQAPAGACQLTGLTLNQTGQTSSNTVTVKKNSGHLMNAVAITVTYSGSCTSANKVLVSGSGAASLGPYQLTYSASPAQFAYNPPTGLCPSASFTTGSYNFSVTLDGSAQTPSANVPFTSVNGSAQC